MKSVPVKIEKTVSSILVFCSKNLPPTPLDIICSRHNVRVYPTSDEEPSFSLGSWISTDCDYFETIAFIPGKADLLTRRHMLAHLLGHILLLHDRCDFGETNAREALATEFATELLIPRKILRRYVKGYDVFSPEARAALELADIFQVKPQLMLSRYRQVTREFSQAHSWGSRRETYA